jgi:uncharacterized protein YodC (DUF2158 family)
MFQQKKFKVSDLRLVARAPSPDNPPLCIGDHCKLNSGGPRMLVVDDASGSVVTVSWDQECSIVEQTLPRECVRRAD